MNRIADYAVIGDCHSLALVGTDGSVDWACFPRFDAPSVFARVLDAGRGGSFSVSPARSATPTRAYVDDTNVLRTTFALDDGSGCLEVADCMPVGPFDPEHPAAVVPRHAVLRHLRCTAGRVEAAMALTPRFEYGAVCPRFTATSATTAEVVGGTSALWVRSTAPLTVDPDAVRGSWSLAEGEEVWLEAAWTPSQAADPPDGEPAFTALPRRLDETLSFWRDWIGRCAYRGDHQAEVRRSALVLKSLIYAPTGAVVAAPTTSLPERVGGERNWDYRFTWIRDATLTLTALAVLGYLEEAGAFKLWLERTGAGRPDDLQIMYGIAGERLLPELTLDHLEGHRRSRPVRIGNEAATQRQLDSYGQVIEAAWLYHRAGGELTPSNWAFVAGLADLTVRRWRTPDHGIWEMRDRPRHFVHSKLHCWLALDRAERLATATGLPGDVERWRAERDLLAEYLVEEGAPHGWFRQAVGVDAPDASTLAVASLGFLPTRHPLVAETIDVVRRDLADGGLVHRYLNPDGLEGGEGAFLLCSFWLLDCLAYAGQLDEAEALLKRLLALANDVGLFAEEVDPATGEHLGNTPQAFTHMALVTSCATLSAARLGHLDGTVATDYAEAALSRASRQG